jgi:hypothetical protein
MYKFKEAARRGSALFAAASLLAGIGASAMPALVSADALNPLTERSLTLSSSSPGWSYLDGSGNTTYAPPNSGANGKQSGETFSFRVSSTGKTIKSMTFQYCTTAAGDCVAPGNDTQTLPTARVDDTSHTDLNVVTATPTEISTGNWTTINSSLNKTPLANDTQGNFVVLHGATSAVTYSGTGDWDMASSTLEAPTAVTGKNNFIKITSTTGQAISTGDYFKVVFFGTNGNYITNPGFGAFFVRINTYSSKTVQDDTTLIDGGVTVANVMNESIQIQTKVLETMSFSVGVHDPDTDTIDSAYTTKTGISTHGQCDPVMTRDPASSTYSTDPHNVLKLGDSTAEYSLATGSAYEVNSYWRLSSNSSGGATVYYTGHTLTNTEGDEITPLTDDSTVNHGLGLGLGTASHPGTEQFGLGINHNADAGLTVGDDTYGSGTGSFADYVTSVNDTNKVHTPELAPLVPKPDYGNGAGGTVNTPATTTGFAFNSHSDTYAIPIASENADVVNCVTAKMRYIANIAATTPAGIYTTKVNYVASPQY